LRSGTSAAASRRYPIAVGAITAAALAALVTIGFVIVAATTALQLASPGLSGAYQARGLTLAGASSLAQRDIPGRYLRLYRDAALRFGIDWAVLAGIGKVECDHGRDPDPACTRPGAVNSSGAGGPMQFLASTWQAYGLDGNRDGSAIRWDPADAIYAAANYLRASGAPGDYRRAILEYNRADWYFAEVMAWAARYRRAGGPPALSVDAESVEGGMAGTSPTPIRFIAGDSAVLARSDGHLALVPLRAPPAVQAMVVAGNELQRLPYGPAGHPDPTGASEEDCSSTVNYVLYRAGVRSIAEILNQNPLAQDYTRWGEPGPGRWVTIYATERPTNHVFAVIAGLRLDTSHNGTDVGPNRNEDGPRWRILNHIPTWARWSIRHPVGL
jgi:hypothetical protein